MDAKKKLLWAGLGAVALGTVRTAIRLSRRMKFDGRVVMITGGSRGLGLAIARRFAIEGANLVLVARDAGELARAEQDLAGYGVELLSVRADVRLKDDVSRAVERALQRFGRIDVLVNDAGVIQVGPLEHMREEDFADAMAVHFWGPLWAMRAVIPSMIARGGGRIVNIASIGGRVPVPHLVPYDASKAALSALSTSMGVELVKHGIRVTTVHPSLIRTGSPVNARFKGRHREEHAWFAVGDSLPFLTMSAERAAKRIVEACRYGDPEPAFSVASRVATVLTAAFPRLTARVLTAVDGLLPAATAADGDASRAGGESGSRWAPSVLTRLSDQAAVRHNELAHGAPGGAKR